RAVSTRRSLDPEDFRDLTKLDPDAIALVTAEAWPLVRDAEEMHDTLMNMNALPAEEGAPWQQWFDELVRVGRATSVSLPESAKTFWIAAERWPMMRAVYPGAVAEPPVSLPAELDQSLSRSDGWVELVRGRIQYIGPVAISKLAADLAIEES